MKIAYISAGFLPIPPDGWGAVENLIWNYKEKLEELGHQVDIYNNKWIQYSISQINEKEYDFIHNQTDMHTVILNKYLSKPFCTTSHYGEFETYIKNVSKDPTFDMIFSDLLESPGNIVLSPNIENLFKNRNYRGFLRTLRNPVEADKFRFSLKGNGKAICVGRIQPRKRQAFLANIAKDKFEVDFVGPLDKDFEPNFKENTTAKFLGSWDKTALYENLTNYSCLVLLSESEAAPLVVLEAMAAGLSIIATKSASANLDNLPFINVIEDNDLDPENIVNIIKTSIDQNSEYREQIRAYTFEKFDYPVILKEYLQIIEQFRNN